MAQRGIHGALHPAGVTAGATDTMAWVGCNPEGSKPALLHS
jgi:hypothetical protein